MPKIFISYRRADSQTFTDRIHDRLEETFGIENVFQDVDDIPPGADFRVAIRQAVSSCDVVLVVIGPGWVISTDLQGRKRLFNVVDYVRIEVETALNSDKLVIPILIDGASPLNVDDLPDSLHDLAYRNAIKIRHNPDFKRDMERLIKRIQGYNEETQRQPSGLLHEISGNSDSARFTESISVLKTSDVVAYNVAVLKVLPSPFEWCFVPGGNVTLETDPPKTYTIPDFAIAKYTITNAQFELFVTERDGYMYETDYGWYNFSNDAQDYRSKNPKPKSTAFTGIDLPRTNVSWYDAVSFTRWLSHRTGLSIFLPTEQQWQRASIGDTGWHYPWGNEFDPARCCYDENSKHKPVPVTEYANGASPYGAVQMSGNVWEWCLTDYMNPDQFDFKATADVRVVRGGSFVDIQDFMRSDSRSNFNPNIGSPNFGFRLVLSSPMS